jgi:hypothetical protein
MHRRGRPHLRRKCPSYIQEGDGFAKCEDNEPRSIASSVDAARGLEDFGCTSVNVRRAVQDRPVLLDDNTVRGW